MFIRALIVYKDKIIIQFNYSPKLTNKKLTSKDIETLTKQVKIPASFIVIRLNNYYSIGRGEIFNLFETPCSIFQVNASVFSS